MWMDEIYCLLVWCLHPYNTYNTNARVKQENIRQSLIGEASDQDRIRYKLVIIAGLSSHQYFHKVGAPVSQY